MRQPPPASTLFPYTTLFRSAHPLRSLLTLFGVILGTLALVVGMSVLDGVDRKSTRLNSSHLVISYAVFCLKKHNGLFYIEYIITVVDVGKYRSIDIVVFYPT